MKLAESMRRDWDERSCHDAFLYIASWRKDWDEKSFFESGEQDYQRFVQPILDRLQFNPREKSMGELGCGVGRMTRSFARRFGSVSAVDISKVMLSRAEILQRDFSNIQWLVSDGDLACIDSASVDFVFSYLVLQHFPSKELVSAAIGEMMRILRPGGIFLFQFNGSTLPTMNWRGTILSSFLDNLCIVGLKRLSQLLARVAGIDPQMIGNTWRGVALQSAEVDATVRSAGGRPAGFPGENTPFAWCFGHKLQE